MFYHKTGNMCPIFRVQSVAACQLSALLPAYCNTSDFKVIEPAGILYSTFLPDNNVDALQMEFMRWQQYWRRQPSVVERPSCVTEALKVASALKSSVVSTAACRSLDVSGMWLN
jgi:hypothetical protein